MPRYVCTNGAELRQAVANRYAVRSDDGDGTVSIHLTPEQAAQVLAKVEEIKAARSTEPEEE
ncbi:hypothetical protein KBY91_19115 [Streptomyces sp. RK23]|uniref:hypothetical protein n=1 Tax=unclassified Streptomyces TaxID=2593676 RepID=UPI001B395D0E|nr:MULTISPECIES: hypothetical protein [unclassified Streptomyces]MBQ0963461.1 hypothetical protein [Streptomyces sp. RK74B]MBQ1005517.1 hypothetical protein [Streptomyces sp. RK23]